jgi:hypothetical protein
MTGYQSKRAAAQDKLAPAPQRPWVGLTDDEDWEHIHDMRGTSLDNFSQGAAWAEAKLKERNK